MATEAQVLARLRPLCLALPEARETVTFGHPTFQAGKRTFAVLETYRGELSLAMKTTPEALHDLLDDPRFYLTPYSGKHAWVSLRVGGRGRLDWREIRMLVEQSYRLVALGRMLKARDAKAPAKTKGPAKTKAPANARAPKKAKAGARQARPQRPRRQRTSACIALLFAAAAARADGPPRDVGPLAPGATHPRNGVAMPHVSIHQLDAQAAHRGGAPAVPPAISARPAPLAPRIATPLKQVHGFHPYWLGTSWQSYDWSLLTTVAYFGIDLDAGGQVVASHGWPATGFVSAAHTAGVRVLVTAVVFDSQALQTLLASPANRQAAAAAIVASVVQGAADGACIDFEGVPGPRKADFVTFVGEVQAALQAALPNPYLSVCSPAVDWGNAYDYDQIAARCDHLMIMAYDYHWANSSATGPVAPLAGWGPYNVGWTIQDYVTWGAPRDKMLLGVPWYGYRWPAVSGTAGAATTGTATARAYAAAAAEAAMYGTQWDAASQTPWLHFQNPAWQQTWYDDTTSLAAKYARVWSEDLAGVGVWALGYDGTLPAMWATLREAFGSRVADVGPTSATIAFAAVGPNPFSDRVTIELHSSAADDVRLDVYSIDGRLVCGAWRGRVEGAARLAWDGRDDSGVDVANGVYLLRATGGADRVTRRVVRLRSR